MQMTDVTWAPIFTTQAVDNPFPKTAARPSCDNYFRILSYTRSICHNSVSVGKQTTNKNNQQMNKIDKCPIFLTWNMCYIFQFLLSK